jgi:hypothetical protein
MRLSDPAGGFPAPTFPRPDGRPAQSASRSTLRTAPLSALVTSVAYALSAAEICRLRGATGFQPLVVCRGVLRHGRGAGSCVGTYLKRVGVNYQRLRGRPALIELGILRMRESENSLGRHFVNALQEIAAAPLTGATGPS